MGRTGEFGHVQSSGSMRQPEDRMLSFGYGLPGSENCHVGSSGPAQAHAVWLRSSSHHRNILDADAYEMGVAARGSYWVQVFGNDSAWLADLQMR